MQVTGQNCFFGFSYDFAWLCKILYEILHEPQNITIQANLLTIT